MAVYRRQADIGAFSNGDWNAPDSMPTGLKRTMRIVGRTLELPRALELVRGDLDPALVQRLKEVLLGMANDPAAAPVLKAYDRTKRFDPITPEIRRQIDKARTFLPVIEELQGAR